MAQSPAVYALKQVWRDMRKRCENPAYRTFPLYGGRGIFVCQEWQDRDTFVAWALPKYRPGLWLDRLDNDGPYHPDNCAFTTRSEQQLNRRKTLWVLLPDGQRHPLKLFAREVGVPYRTLCARHMWLRAQGIIPDRYNLTIPTETLLTTQPNGGSLMRRKRTLSTAPEALTCQL